MIWPILIMATLSSVLVAIALSALGIRKLPIVLCTQVFVAFAVSYAVTVGFTEAPKDPRVVWFCLIAAAAIPGTWAVLAVILGPPLQRRRMRASSR